MKILLVNYRYFISGGPERYLFNISKIFERYGHHVIPFSIFHEKNVKTPYEKYFLSPIGDGHQVYFHEIKKTPRNIAKMLARNYYSFEAKSKLTTLLRENSIDVAYILNFSRWISPSIFDTLSENNIPIIVRISDHHLLCPQVNFLRDNKPCELCKTGNFFYAIKYKCVQDSYTATLVEIFAKYFHRTIGIFNHVNKYVIPSQFLLQKMIEGGYPKSKLVHIPTFIDCKNIYPEFTEGSYILYFGRISAEKGMDILLNAWKLLTIRLKSNSRLIIVRSSKKGEKEHLITRVKKEGILDVCFYDHLEGKKLDSLIRGAICTVLPSICFENLPNSILESFAYGKPVIASKIGSLTEIIEHKKNGFLFPPRNIDELCNLMMFAINNRKRMTQIGNNARAYVESKYSPQQHYSKLIEIFTSFLSR